MYFKNLNRGLNAEFGAKDFYEIGSRLIAIPKLKAAPGFSTGKCYIVGNAKTAGLFDLCQGTLTPID